MRRSLWLPIIIVGVVVVGAAIYLFLFKGSSSVTPGSPGTTGSLPSVGTQTGSGNNGGGNTAGQGTGGAPVAGLPSANGPVKFGIVSDEPVLAYMVDAQNNVAIVEPDGKIATVSAGQVNMLSSSAVQNVLNAGVSYNSQKAFVNFGDPANPQTSIFDLTAKTWTPLPAGIMGPVWSPTDNRIAYLKNNSDGSVSLATIDVSKATNKPVLLSTFAVQDLTIGWPNKNQIILQDRPSVYAQGGAWTFDLSKKTLSRIATPVFGFEAAWSMTTSTTALVLSSPMYGRSGSLALVYPFSTSTQPLNLQTLPSKCAFNYEVPATSTAAAASTTAGSSTTTAAGAAPTPYLALYCGVPRSSNDYSIAILPDDYNQMAVFTSDDFYRINTDTGVLEQIFSPGVSVDSSNPHVFNNILFFVNRYDHKLYAISLAG